MATIKLAFFKADTRYGTLVSKIISKWTKSPYSHVELIIDKDIVLNYKPEIKDLLDTTYAIAYGGNLIESNFNYIQFTSSSNYNGVRMTYHKVNDSKYDYLELNIDHIEWVIDFFYEIRFSRYDNIGILGFVLPFKDRTDRWFCSESCSNALKITGFKPMWLLEPSSISPGKLYTMVKRHIEGNKDGAKN